MSPAGTRKYEASDLVGMTEIAARLKVPRETVRAARRRDPSFPAPITQLQQALIWSWRDVERWARSIGWPDYWPRRRRST